MCLCVCARLCAVCVHELDAVALCVLQLCGGGSVTDLVKALLLRDSRMDELTIAHILRETLKVDKILHFIQ